MAVNVQSAGKLLSYEFLALCLVIAAAFCNVSVFYSFYHYLGEIAIPPVWRGFLVGLEPMTAFILRLFVLPWLHLRNAFSVAMASTFLLIVTSCLYLWTTTVPAMIALRVMHGSVFVLLTSSVIALIVSFIPPEKSGQGFSMISVATMIPYALIPLLTEALLPHMRSEADIYAAVSIFSVIALLLMAALRGRIHKALSNMDRALMRRPALSEIRENFRLPAVVLLIIGILFVYLAHATVFYFLKDLSLQSRAGDVGYFFTISMVVMIAVRAAGGLLFDRLNKLRLLQAGLLLLILCLISIPHAGSPGIYYPLAGLYGFAVGIILPLFNALLFSASPPTLRGLNTNLTLFMLDAGYFLMPYVGGMLIAAGVQFAILFYGAAGCAMMASAFIVALIYLRKETLTHEKR